MAIFKTIASAALLVASSGWSDAFTPASLGRGFQTNNNINIISNTALCAVIEDSTATPCDAPSDVETVVMDDAKFLRNALVTNIKGELVSLGDAMTTKSLSEKTFDTSVVVFLRHMG